MLLFNNIKKIIEKISSYRSSSSNKIPDGQKEEFKEEITRINYVRSRNLSVLLLFVLIVLIFLDYDSFQKGHWIDVPGYRLLFYSHVVMALGMLAVLTYSILAKLNTETAQTKLKRIFVLAFCFIISISSVLVSIADQFIHGEITVYILSVFALAILFPLAQKAQKLTRLPVRILPDIMTILKQRKRDVSFSHSL